MKLIEHDRELMVVLSAAATYFWFHSWQHFLKIFRLHDLAFGGNFILFFSYLVKIITGHDPNCFQIYIFVQYAFAEILNKLRC